MITLLLLAALQTREIFSTQVEIVEGVGADAVIREVSPDPDRSHEAWTPDLLARLLDDADPAVRRNAACALGTADSVAHLVFLDGDRWPTKLRVAEARFKIDGDRALLRELLRDPSRRAREAAAKILGEEPPELPAPDLSAAIAALAADDAAERDRASRELAAAPESALPSLEQARAAARDPEVRVRLEHAIAAIRARDLPPVELADNGIVVQGEYTSRSLTLTNHTDEPLSLYGYSLASPLYGREMRKDGAWVSDFLGWCGTGAGRHELAPGASVTFTAMESEGEYRVTLGLRGAARTIKACSPAFTPGR